MSPAEAVQKNPSVTGAAGGGGAGFAVVWFVGNVWPRAALSAEDGAVIATAAATAVGYMARHGLAGIWRTIRYGSAYQRPPAGP